MELHAPGQIARARESSLAVDFSTNGMGHWSKENESKLVKLALRIWIR